MATRRLREAVPVLTAGVKGTKEAKARRKIRRLTRALGTVRELDVAVAILDELTRKQRVPRPAVEEVRGHVLAERDRRRELMLERLDKIDPSKLTRRLTSVAAALQDAGTDGWRDALAARLMKRSKALRSVIAEAGQIYAPDRLHRVRIAAKKLRYALEIAAESGVKPAVASVRVLKRVQAVLGRLNDLQVLQMHVAAVQANGHNRSVPANAGLDTLARVLEEECRHLHGRYVSAIPALTAVCDETRAVVVPRLARPHARRRPVKMTLPAAAPRKRAAAAAH